MCGRPLAIGLRIVINNKSIYSKIFLCVSFSKLLFLSIFP